MAKQSQIIQVNGEREARFGLRDGSYGGHAVCLWSSISGRRFQCGRAQDMEALAAAAHVRDQRYQQADAAPPVATAVEVRRLFLRGALLELVATAYTR